MAKKVLEIKNFTGGLNCSLDSRDIELNEFAQAYNISSSQEGILKHGGGLVQNIFNLPHNNVNFQEGYGLFATSVDSSPSIIQGQFESGFEEGTVAGYSGTSLTLATLPTFQSKDNHETNNFYRNMTVVIISGTYIGESRRIVSYTGDTQVAVLTDAFSGDVSSSRYKIFNWAGDNSKFGNQDELDYIDKGGTSFPYDDINSAPTGYPNSYFLRTKSTTLSDGTSADLGFATYNPATDYDLPAATALGPENTSIGNTRLDSGITYTMSFWCKTKYQYYGYGADANSSSQRRERVPFIQIYSDSVTDGTNTGLYLFQSNNGTSFQSGAETTYDYADNLTTEYVKNGDFEGGTATGGAGGYNGTYDPPTDWKAYDGFVHGTNNTIEYSYISGANSFGADSTGTSGKTLNMNPGSAFLLNNFNNAGIIPNCYMYQDLTLEDNQWYELSFVYSTDKGGCAFSIVDASDLTSTGVLSNEGTNAQSDGAVEINVDTVVPTDALLKNREVNTTTGGAIKFLGVCTAVADASPDTVTFAAGTGDDIDENDEFFTANYIKPWHTGLSSNNHTGGLTTYMYGGKEKSSTKKKPYRFFVPANSGTARVIRIAFAPLYHDQNLRLDGVSVKKSFPDLSSMSEDSPGNPYSSEVSSWNKYQFQFKIPPEYNNATDWVINLNAGSYYYQAGAAGSQTHQITYFDDIKIQQNSYSGNLIFLNDNTSSESKINIYSENEGLWSENTGLTWKGLNMKPVYTYINGMLKISDANFQSGNSSKLFYHQDGAHKVRGDVLSSPPELLVSSSTNSNEVNTYYNALNYINTYVYEGNHQYYLNGDTKTTTNWPLDNLSTFDGGGGERIIRYHHHSNITDLTDLQADVGESTVLVDPFDNSTELTKVITTTGATGGSTAGHAYADTITNPSYYTWCGTHGGSGDIATYDMHTEISGTTTGSVSRIIVDFNYRCQGDHGSTNNKIPTKIYPPNFIIKAGKRSSDATDIFGSGTEVTDNNQRDLSLGDAAFIGMENVRQAKIYKGYSGNSITDEGNEYKIQSEVDAGIYWENSEMFPWRDDFFINNGEQVNINGSFRAEISFDDGEIELADDIILEFYIENPKNEDGDNLIDGLAYNFPTHPVFEKIGFHKINTFFRSTNWSAVSDGMDVNSVNNTKTNFKFAAPSGATAFGWGERIFEIGVSSVNIFNEESNIEPSPTSVGSTVTNLHESSISMITEGQSPDIDIYIGENALNDNYRNKIKYYMKDTTSDIWYLQFYVDLKTNTAHSTTSNFKTIGSYDSTNKFYHYYIPREQMLNYNEVDSYESQTLVSQNLNKNQLTCDYKTAVVANNRLYVGNIKQNGEIFPDRMIKSPIGKYNILPKDNFIDVAINDGDEITALEYYKDKLLQFKKRKVFVINTSGDYEFLEETFDNIGVDAPYQVCKTPYGIAWANQSGLHLYDGSQIVNLIDGKIANQKENENITDNWWQVGSTSAGVKSNATNHTASVGYDPKQKDIIVKRGIKGGTSENAQSQVDGYIYNLVHKSWYMTHKVFNGISRNTYQTAMSNFANDSEGNLISYNYQAFDNSGDDIIYGINDIMKWKHAQAGDDLMCAQRGISSADTNEKLMYFTTADFTFGNIATRKKIYKVYVTYQCDANSDVLVTYRTNGSGAFSNTFADSSTNYAASTGLANTSSNWETAELIPSSSINNIYSFQLQFTDFANLANGSSSINFKINDISIVYREKRVK